MIDKIKVPRAAFNIKLMMPKFRIDYNFDKLVKILREFRVEKIFSPNVEGFAKLLRKKRVEHEGEEGTRQEDEREEAGFSTQADLGEPFLLKLIPTVCACFSDELFNFFRIREHRTCRILSTELS